MKIAVIPARGGSKRIPRKNIKKSEVSMFPSVSIDPLFVLKKITILFVNLFINSLMCLKALRPGSQQDQLKPLLLE